MRSQFTHHFERDDGEITATVSYTYSPARRSRNPDDPGDPAEVDIISVVAEDGSQMELSKAEEDELEREAISHGDELIAEHRQEAALDNFIATHHPHHR